MQRLWLNLDGRLLPATVVHLYMIVICGPQMLPHHVYELNIASKSQVENNLDHFQSLTTCVLLCTHESLGTLSGVLRKKICVDENLMPVTPYL